MRKTKPITPAGGRGTPSVPPISADPAERRRRTNAAIYTLMNWVQAQRAAGATIPGAGHEDLVAAVLAWESEGHPDALIEAFCLFVGYGKPIPKKLARAIVPLMQAGIEASSQGRGRLASWAERSRQDEQYLQCWRALRAARRAGDKGPRALETARRELATQGLHLGDKAIANGYRKVEQHRQLVRREGLRFGRFYPEDPLVP